MKKFCYLENNPELSGVILIKTLQLLNNNTPAMKKNSTSAPLAYTSKFINANFRIKAYGLDAAGNKINKLVAVAGALALIGAELLNKFIARTLKSGLDKCVCKLRRGLKITLYLR